MLGPNHSYVVVFINDLPDILESYIPFLSVDDTTTTMLLMASPQDLQVMIEIVERDIYLINY